ncbi:2-C-methyl-D-erythritol 2,4-cyclodiphosphate synthase [Babesia ovis]|uniref:2-C-methyl-D-erythritol 2,4-cyclodiphosphate synthase n=1 Tax=Babesia ovis TaxID=5869 RepID=A0A9W5WW30_BABOV|nr:2-C-methyl-D-erythritol 2,4-cyclodiphosphate synthase [Babesia ovis]
MISFKVLHLVSLALVYLIIGSRFVALGFRQWAGHSSATIHSLPTQTLHNTADTTHYGVPHRVGIGYDIHRLVGPDEGGKPFRLGGVQVEDPNIFVVGHSDGDAVLHAVSDAILGALGLGDIGEHFSDLDSSHKDMDSRTILNFALSEASKLGYRPSNVDINIILQRPRLGTELKNRVRSTLSELLGPGVCVNVKAKTNEGIDALGRGEAVACQAVALMKYA